MSQFYFMLPNDGDDVYFPRTYSAPDFKSEDPALATLQIDVEMAEADLRNAEKKHAQDLRTLIDQCITFEDLIELLPEAAAYRKHIEPAEKTKNLPAVNTELIVHGLRTLLSQNTK